MSINWHAIHNSPTWQEQIVPWLRELRADALEDMAIGKHDDEVKYWQGYAKALQAVIETPQDMIEADRLNTKQENEDAGRRDNSRRDHIAALRRAFHFTGRNRTDRDE